MLRAVRFATVLDYMIDPKTWDALIANANSINEISAERIRDELVRIFLSPNRVRGWDLLDSSGLMRAMLWSPSRLPHFNCYHRTRRSAPGRHAAQRS